LSRLWRYPRCSPREPCRRGANTLFRLLVWNGDGKGTLSDVGFLDSGPAGIVQLSIPMNAVFALTDAGLPPPR